MLRAPGSAAHVRLQDALLILGAGRVGLRGAVRVQKLGGAEGGGADDTCGSAAGAKGGRIKNVIYARSQPERA